MLIISILLTASFASVAQWDTAASPRLLSPAAGTTLAAGGTLFTFIPDLKAEAVSLRNAVQADGHSVIHLDDYMQYLPIIAPLTMSICGLESRHDLGRMALLEGGSYLLGFVILESAKYGLGVQRPDTGAPTSFPSGHTFTAFTGAEVIRHEYGQQYPWLVVAGYTVAAVVGGMRIYNNRHWLGDVLAGAGLGILSTNIIYMIFD